MHGINVTPDIGVPVPAGHLGQMAGPGRRTEPSPITIALVSDHRYVRPLSVAMASIAAHADGHPHDLFVLHDGLGSRLLTKIERSVRALHVTWLDARSPTMDALLKPDYLARSSLYRLRLEELLPSDVDRVLYLDADVLVRRPLAELWSTPLEDKMVAAVRDPAAPWVSAVRNFPWVELGIGPSTPYFNAGVMLMSLKLWREADVSARAIQLLERCELGHGDQCALNAVLSGRWRSLDPCWNTQWAHLVDTGTLAWVAETETKNGITPAGSAIMHFNASRMLRPWEPRCEHPFRDEWLTTLRQTSWPRWHPSRNGKFRRGLQRLKRAALAIADSGASRRGQR